MTMILLNLLSGLGEEWKVKSYGPLKSFVHPNLQQFMCKLTDFLFLRVPVDLIYIFEHML